MPPPIKSSNGSILDGGVGVLPADTTAVSAKIGHCTGGTAGKIYTYRGTDVQKVISELISGQLVDDVIAHLIQSGGKTVHAYKAAASTAGTSSPVTRSGGTSGPAITLVNEPNDHYENVLVIVQGGAVGTATFKVSHDGGDTYSGEISTASTYDLPTGVRVSFPAGTYVAGETYSWTDTAPALTSGDIGTAVDALLTSSVPFSWIHVLGHPASASDALTIATMLSTKRVAAHAAHRYIFFVFEAPPVDKTTLASTFANFVDQFVIGCGGFAEITRERTDVAGASVLKRSSGRVIVPRIARNPISVDPSRTINDAKLDPISQIKTLVPDGAAASTGYHDENRTPGLNAARFAHLRTYDQKEGFFIGNVPTFAGATSDMPDVMRIRILLRAAEVFYQWSLDQLGRRLRKDPKTGFILPSIADSIEDEALEFVKAAVGSHVDGLAILLNRQDDLAADPVLRAKIRIVGPDYAYQIDWELALAKTLPQTA